MKLSLGQRIAALIVSTVLIVGLAGYIAGQSVVRQVASLIDDKALISGLEEGRKALAALHRERRSNVESAIFLCIEKSIWPSCPKIEAPFSIAKDTGEVPEFDSNSFDEKREYSGPAFQWPDEQNVFVRLTKNGTYEFQKVVLDWEPIKPKFAKVSETISTHEHVGNVIPDLIASFTFVFAGILAITGAFALFVTWVLSRGIARRVRDLISYTRKIGRGEAVDAPESTKGNDEIGMLSSALQNMTVDLVGTRKKLILAEKMNSWQNVARKVAHEIKNPLTPLSLVGSEMQRLATVNAGQSSKELTNFLQLSGKIIEEETASLGRMVKEFTAFARLPRPAPGDENLATLVSEFVQRNTTSDGPLLAITKQAEVDFSCRVDRSMIFQIFHNMLNNARLAVHPQRASVKFDVGLLRLANYECEGADTTPSSFSEVLFVDITDNGPGVPKVLEDSLFDAYVTTRSTGDGEKGMGLGLTISRKIASDHGGSLELKHSSDTGAVFRLTVPLAKDANFEKRESHG